MLRVSCSLRRAALSAFAASAVSQPCRRALQPGPLSAGPSTSPTSGVPTASLVTARRFYARKPNANDSNTEDVSHTFFDVQDVDADRLTHFYWDSNDNADTPYDTFLLDSLLSEGYGDEWSRESLAFVDERDHQLLEDEYLR